MILESEINPTLYLTSAKKKDFIFEDCQVMTPSNIVEWMHDITTYHFVPLCSKNCSKIYIFKVGGIMLRNFRWLVFHLQYTNQHPHCDQKFDFKFCCISFRKSTIRSNDIHFSLSGCVKYDIITFKSIYFIINHKPDILEKAHCLHTKKHLSLNSDKEI